MIFFDICVDLKPREAQTINTCPCDVEYITFGDFKGCLALLLFLFTSSAKKISNLRYLKITKLPIMWPRWHSVKASGSRSKDHRFETSTGQS